VASLQATHRRGCAVGKQWTPGTDDRLRDCTCEPTFYVVVRQGSAVKRERAGNNRRDAERALRRVAVAEDAGTYEPVRNIGFTDWADQWLDGLERRKNTKRGYESVMRRAKRALGQKPVKRASLRSSAFASRPTARTCSWSKRPSFKRRHGARTFRRWRTSASSTEWTPSQRSVEARRAGSSRRSRST
jgi:hypothetical protein